MTNYQKSLLMLFKLIVAEAKKKLQSIALIPKFKETIEALEALIAEIEALQVKQGQDKKGITVDTNQVISDLKDFLVDISGALQSYATAINNNTLYELINFSENAIHQQSKKDIVAVSTLITENACKLKPEELAAWGISAEDLAECVRLQEIVRQEGQAPQHAIIEGAGYTEQLAHKIETAYKLKKNTLDKLATQFKRKDPEFFQIYESVNNVSYRKSSRKNGNSEETSVDETTNDVIEK